MCNANRYMYGSFISCHRDLRNCMYLQSLCFFSWKGNYWRYLPHLSNKSGIVLIYLAIAIALLHLAAWYPVDNYRIYIRYCYSTETSVLMRSFSDSASMHKILIVQLPCTLINMRNIIYLKRVWILTLGAETAVFRENYTNDSWGDSAKVFTRDNGFISPLVILLIVIWEVRKFIHKKLNVEILYA